MIEKGKEDVNCAGKKPLKCWSSPLKDLNH